MDALYVIGEPGAGKSTLVEYLTAGLPYEETDSPFAMRRYDCGVLELGRRREAFSGTDALGMSVQPKVVQFLEGVQPKLVLAEGDRLGNGKFFASLYNLGYNLWLYELFGADTARRHREQRGSHQDPKWLKGRQTKVAALGERFDAIGLRAGMPMDYYTDLMADPVTDRLLGRVAAVPAGAKE